MRNKVNLAMLLLLLVVWAAAPSFLSTTTTFTVSSTERVDDKYMVFTDKGAYENTDCWRAFKFNSSDLYGKLEEGKTYTAKVYGPRIPILSRYKNILEVE